MHEKQTDRDRLTKTT